MASALFHIRGAAIADLGAALRVKPAGDETVLRLSRSGWRRGTIVVDHVPKSGRVVAAQTGAVREPHVAARQLDEHSGPRAGRARRALRGARAVRGARVRVHLLLRWHGGATATSVLTPRRRVLASSSWSSARVCLWPPLPGRSNFMGAAAPRRRASPARAEDTGSPVRSPPGDAPITTTAPPRANLVRATPARGGRAVCACRPRLPQSFSSSIVRWAGGGALPPH